jgi:hypothetical protein
MSTLCTICRVSGVIFINRPYHLNAGNGDEEHLKIHVNSAILSAKSSYFKGLFESTGENVEVRVPEEGMLSFSSNLDNKL